MREGPGIHNKTKRLGSLIKTILGASLLLFSAIIIYAQPVFAAGQGGLAGYWKLDETTAGSTAIDSSGMGNNLTPSGSPQPSTNVPAAIRFPDSRSLAFNGSNTLDMANPVGVNYGTSPRSLSAWIYPTAAPSSSTTAVPAAYGQCVYNGVSTNLGMEFGFYLDSSMDLHFWGCGSNYDFNTNQTIPLDQWSNVVVTYNGSTVIVYLNGVLIASQARTMVSQGSSTPQVEIGSASLMDGTPDYFTGNVDDVRIYTRALSPTEVSELAHTGNTAATWTGGTSASWLNPSNWNIDAVPDAYTDIVVGSGTYQPVLTTATGMANLTINAGSLLNLNGQNLTMNDAGSFINNGTLILQGNENVSGLINVPTSGTVEYDGSSTYSSLAAGNIYHGLIFDGTGSWTLNGPLTVDGNLNIVNGTVSSDGNNISVGGNWSNNGTYNANGNTVTLNGNSQSIAGSTTFYNLTKTTSNTDTLTFTAGYIQSITNNLTLQGTTGHLLSLVSSSLGSQWDLNPTGSYNLNYLAIQDSDNLGATLLNPSNSIDNGDNTNWFPPYKPTALGPSMYTQGIYVGSSRPALSFRLSDSNTSENVKYQIEIATNSSFSNPVINYTSASMSQGIKSFIVGQSAGAGSYTIGYPGQFLSNGSYYWRVQMYGALGNSSGFVTANNGAIAFKVDTTPPTVPGTPIATTPTTDTTPTWVWTASTDSESGLAATPYTVEWSQDPNFSSGVSLLATSTTSFTQPSALSVGTWYFRVKAVDAVGNYSAYSNPGMINIENPPAPNQTTNTNINNTTTVSSPLPSGHQSAASTAAVTPTATPAKQSPNNVLLNNSPAFNSNQGERLNLVQGQNVRLVVNGRVNRVTVAKVGSDYATLMLGSGTNARNVTLHTGETNQYDINGNGKPNITVKLIGTNNGVAELSFSDYKLAAIQVSLAGQGQGNSNALIYWITGIVVVLAFIGWFVLAKRQHTPDNRNV